MWPCHSAMQHSYQLLLVRLKQTSTNRPTAACPLLCHTTNPLEWQQKGFHGTAHTHTHILTLFSKTLTHSPFSHILTLHSLTHAHSPVHCVLAGVLSQGRSCLSTMCRCIDCCCCCSAWRLLGCTSTCCCCPCCIFRKASAPACPSPTTVVAAAAVAV